MKKYNWNAAGFNPCTINLFCKKKITPPRKWQCSSKCGVLLPSSPSLPKTSQNIHNDRSSINRSSIKNNSSRINRTNNTHQCFHRETNISGDHREKHKKDRNNEYRGKNQEQSVACCKKKITKLPGPATAGQLQASVPACSRALINLPAPFRAASTWYSHLSVHQPLQGVYGEFVWGQVSCSLLPV